MALSFCLYIQAQGSLSSDELRVHLSVPSDNVVINNTNTHTYSSRYQRIHTFPDDRDREGEYQEPSTVLRPREQRDSTGDTHKTHTHTQHSYTSLSKRTGTQVTTENEQHCQKDIRKSTLGQSTSQTQRATVLSDGERREGDFISLTLLLYSNVTVLSAIVAFMTNTLFLNHCVIVFYILININECLRTD